MVALLLSLALRVPFFSAPMIHDEGGYAYAARGWLDGSGQLYGDLWISRPQGIFVTYALVFRTLGYSVMALRFAAWIAAAGTVGAAWCFARRWSSGRVANTTAVLCAILISLPTLEGFTANAELFSGLPAAWAMWLLLRMGQTRWSPTWLVATGALIGVSTSLKPSGVMTLVPAIGFIWLVHRGLAWRQQLAPQAWLLAGVALIGVISLIHGYTLGWSNFIYATVTYRLTLQSSFSYGMLHNVKQFFGMLWNIAPLVALMLLVVGLRLIYPVRPVQYVPTTARAWRRRLRFRPSTDRGGQLIQLWAIGGLLGMAMGGDWWPHYVIQIVPPIAFWLAWNTDGLLQAMRGWRKWLSMAMLAYTLTMPYAVVFGGAQVILEQIYHHPGYPAQAEVAQYIRDHSSPDDTIYVAFDQASIYYLSGRRPAYRHLYDQELRALPDSYADIIHIISGPDRPIYIVSSLHPGPFPDDSRAFWQEVGRYYTIETTIDGVPIYRANPTPGPRQP